VNEFCPKCGSTKGPFIDGFCEKCYLEDHELIETPEEFEVQKCNSCGRVRLFGKWVDFSKENLAVFFEKKIKLKELASPKVEIELIEKESDEFEVKIVVAGEIAGERIQTQKTVPLHLAPITCPSCGKLSAGYFEAKIQVRWQKERDERREKKIYFELKRALKKQQAFDPLAVITKHETVPTGEDIFIGSNKAARIALSQLKKKFNAKILSTKKLVGRNESGRNKYRFTYRLKL